MEQPYHNLNFSGDLIDLSTPRLILVTSSLSPDEVPPDVWLEVPTAPAPAAPPSGFWGIHLAQQTLPKRADFLPHWVRVQVAHPQLLDIGAWAANHHIAVLLTQEVTAEPAAEYAQFYNAITRLRDLEVHDIVPCLASSQDAGVDPAVLQSFQLLRRPLAVVLNEAQTGSEVSNIHALLAAGANLLFASGSVSLEASILALQHPLSSRPMMPFV